MWRAGWFAPSRGQHHIQNRVDTPVKPRPGDQADSVCLPLRLNQNTREHSLSHPCSHTHKHSYMGEQQETNSVRGGPTSQPGGLASTGGLLQQVRSDQDAIWTGTGSLWCLKVTAATAGLKCSWTPEQINTNTQEAKPQQEGMPAHLEEQQRSTWALCNASFNPKLQSIRRGQTQQSEEKNRHQDQTERGNGKTIRRRSLRKISTTRKIEPLVSAEKWKPQEKMRWGF